MDCCDFLAIIFRFWCIARCRSVKSAGSVSVASTRYILMSDESNRHLGYTHARTYNASKRPAQAHNGKAPKTRSFKAFPGVVKGLEERMQIEFVCNSNRIEGQHQIFNKNNLFQSVFYRILMSNLVCNPVLDKSYIIILQL